MMNQKKQAVIEHWLEVEDWQIENEAQLLEWLISEAEIEKLSGIYNLIFVSNENIQEINKEYLNCDEATDVIAFDLTDEKDDINFIAELPEDELVRGEVYVSLERAAEQSLEYGVSLSEETGRLALHGILHLAGWLDNNDEARKRMKIREDEGLDRVRSRSGDYPWSIIAPA